MNKNQPSLDQICHTHGQQQNWYCSVSAIEFIAKLYGLLELNSFPLQSDPGNQKKGFADKTLQDALGLQGEEMYLQTQSALEAIEEETNHARFVAVSLLLFQIDGTILGYDIYVAVSKAGRLVLIDPANGQETVPTKEDLTKVLEQNSQSNPERKTIHILRLRPKA